MEFIKLLMILIATATTTAAAAQAKPGCKRQCGNVSVPYPFGTEEGCYLEDKFLITCNHTSDDGGTPRAFLVGSNIEVLEINILDGWMRIFGIIASDCYNSSGRSSNTPWLMSGDHYISHKKNKFTAIGCDTYAFINGSVAQGYISGCRSMCDSVGDVTDGTCSGTGCCQVDIPKGVADCVIWIASYSNHSEVSNFNPCSFAFVVEDGAYNFSTSDLRLTYMTPELPMILDWAVGNQSCHEAKKKPESYACKENSFCVEPENGEGYLCNCTAGFEGNPYVGCQDIDECATENPCNGTCKNTYGNFTCLCPEGFEGDGLRNGKGCTPIVKHQNERIPIVHIAVGMSIGVFALFLSISWSLLIFRQRRIAKLREKYFKQNGGILLQEHLSEREGSNQNFRIFVADELKKATNNYHESRIIGRGGQGTVYRGILPGNRMVAIKKAKIEDESQVKPFVNELSMLCKINHRNVVKLLGCCLETPVPLLVYEYVTNGSLYDHMHNVVGGSFLSWETRLSVATETAQVLSYLHSAASVPIIHRDIKLANILLDDQFTAKVSDFGASTFIPSNHTQIATIVQGTFGYMDPEYMRTSMLSEKSDVYSFGVVLIELLTGQKVVSFERSEEKRVLAMYFISMMKENCLLEILDHRVVNDGNIEQLKEVAAFAWQCVSMKGEERPTMKEVAHKLEGLQETKRYYSGTRNAHAQETKHLHGELTNTYDYYATSSSMGYDSINEQVTFELEGGR